MEENLHLTGVYKIFFKNKPKRIYIGSTGFERLNSIKTGFYQRRYNHLNSLRRKKHGNRFLQRAFNKYGEENFVFEIVEICYSNFLIREQYWMDLYQSYNSKFGYNLLKKQGRIKDIKKTSIQIEKHRKSLLKYFESNEVHNKKINDLLISNVKKYIDDNMYYKDICEKLNIKKSTYYNIKAKLSTGLQ